MKIRSMCIPLLMLSTMLLFCGCDGSPDASKPTREQSRSGEQSGKKSPRQPPSFQKQDGTPSENKSAGTLKKNEGKNDPDPAQAKGKNGGSSGKGTGSGQGGNGSASSGNGRGGGGSASSGSGQGGNGSASGGNPSGGKGGTGTGAGGQGGYGNGGSGDGTGGGSFSGGSDRGTGGAFPGGSHRRDGSRKTAPPGWTSSEVKQAPNAADSEIWANIISCLEKLIVGSEIRFSPLGAKHTSLTSLAEKKYKAVGRCLVVDKSGNQFAYEFECIARANKYDAVILSVKFTER